MYHDRSYELLGRTPVCYQLSLQQLKITQQRLNLVLPASVLEWYQQDDALQVLLRYSNGDPPIELHDWVTIEWQGRKLLPFRRENQGVCIWAIELNGSDDPPVLVDVDSDGREWNSFSHSFTDCVYAGIWDYTWVLDQVALVQAQNAPLTTMTVQALQARFNQSVWTSGWPGNTQYRFLDNSQNGILIWDSGDQADWFVGAPSADALRAMLASVRSLDNVGNSLYDCTPEGKSALDHFRAS